MVRFSATIKRFASQGEKTGWSYIEISADLAEQLKVRTRTSFRVKGKLDQFAIAGVSLLPMRGGGFIMPINAAMRKGTGKRYGAMLKVELTEDKTPFRFNQDFMACLDDEPDAKAFFQTLTPSHQRYFSKWIDDAKTETTRTKRIAQAVTALARRMGYGEMLRSEKKDREQLK